MKHPFVSRTLALTIAALLVAALPTATHAAPLPAKRFPADLFPLHLSDELQGPLFGPVKKAILKNGESYWTVSFSRDGRPLGREQFIPGLTSEAVVFDAGRPVKRLESPGTDRQTVVLVSYDSAGRSFKLTTPGQSGTMAEFGAGTLSPQGFVAAKTIRFSDGGLHEAVYEYDAAGLVARELSHTTRRGTTTVDRVYDRTGRILSRLTVGSSQPDGPPAADGQSKLEYRYDLQGRLTDIFFLTDKPPAAVNISVQGEYDGYGNWTKLVMTKRDAAGQTATQVFTQNIEYY